MPFSHAPRPVGPIGLRKAAALAASTLLALAPSLQAGPPPAQAATGTIKGKLVWGGAVPTPKVEDTSKSKDAVCKVKPIQNKDLLVDPATKGVAYGIAYLVAPAALSKDEKELSQEEKKTVAAFKAAEKALLEKTPEVVIDQVNCEFVPYVSVVHKDQKLTFKSSDPVGHNVRFTPFANSPINQMLPPNGKMAYPIKKEERRPTAIACDIHPWMKGHAFILAHPFAVVTKEDGTFEIAGVPAGAQQLVVWQSTKGYVNTGGNKGMAVTVPAGETVDVGAITIK